MSRGILRITCSKVFTRHQPIQLQPNVYHTSDPAGAVIHHLQSMIKRVEERRERINHRTVPLVTFDISITAESSEVREKIDNSKMTKIISNIKLDEKSQRDEKNRRDRRDEKSKLGKYDELKAQRDKQYAKLLADIRKRHEETIYRATYKKNRFNPRHSLVI